MAIVRSCNSHYERFKKSRIHTFTGLLKPKRFVNTTMHLQSIENEWKKVPDDAKRRYDPAWQFVYAELLSKRPPGPGAKLLPGMGGGMGAQAAQVARARNVRTA